jgi:dienelactone hydrolase
MRWRMSLSVLAAVFFAAMLTRFHEPSRGDETIGRSAGPVGSPEGRYNRQLWWIPVADTSSGKDKSSGNTADKVLLETMVYSPPGSGPFPLVTINHGKPAPGSDLRSERPDFEKAAHWFVERGFIVAVPLRRGYGRSQGVESDMVGTCATLDYVATSEQAAMDIEGVIAYLGTQRDVDADHVIVVGHSHGGFAALGVAADAHKGVRAIVNFAGGTGSWGLFNAMQLPRRLVQGRLCNGRDNLLSALNRLGERNSLPQLWLYAVNDRTFDPELAQAMFQAYRERSRFPISFVALPASPVNGHLLFAQDDVSSWAPYVDRFLQTLQIPGYRAVH